MFPLPRKQPILASCALLVLAGCGDTVAPKDPVEHLVAVSGSGQMGRTLDTLAEPMVVRVVDDGGNPVAGVPVAWRTSDETMRVIPVDPVTTADGRSRALVVLGFNPGPQRVDAAVEGVDATVRFEHTANGRVGFKAIALMQGAADSHTCAIDADSLAWCWGMNQFGQLGDGSNSASEIPRRVATDMRFASIYGTSANTCALTSAGALWCWGSNASGGSGVGVFGNGTDQPSLVPVRGAPGLRLIDFDMDADVACGVAVDGRGYCWGKGDDALGTGQLSASSSVPLELAGSRRWREIAVGDDRRCAIADDWRVYCWAEPHLDWWSWISVRPDAGPANTPLLVESVGRATNISSSWYNQCGLSADGAGTAVCWGVAYTGLFPFTAPGPAWLRLPTSVRRIWTERTTGLLLDGQGAAWMWGEPPVCCDGFFSAVPAPIYPGGSWSDASIAGGLYLISARDSTVYEIRSFPFPHAGSPLTPLPIPAP